jgi:hypothetical protein
VVNAAQQIGGWLRVAVLNTLATAAATTYLIGRTPSVAVSADAAVHRTSSCTRSAGCRFSCWGTLR